ncbi:MAG TPA: DUF448 domain-containing protein [Micrococcales bacterium]|uniref:YlxR family protein n=1 Tax=Miniimonas arenae TaxID=676201 RepID=UPI000ECCAD71|nr:YlxR family protein [Miniimonas arenae]HCX85589.1 DUF448 domain-containing protein [Micrococcales bacterium]
MDGSVSPRSSAPDVREPVTTSAPTSSRADARPAPGPGGPVRTCVGCRGKGARTELVRLVREGDHPRVVVDEGRSAPGRGGWLHPSQSCLELALRRGGVVRALRLQGPVDTTTVVAWFESGAVHGAASASAPGRSIEQSNERRERVDTPMGTR